MGFCFDLFIQRGKPQGIFYQINSAQTAVAFEYWVTSVYDPSDPIYHFIINYNINHPGIWTVRYYTMAQDGARIGNIRGVAGVQCRCLPITGLTPQPCPYVLTWFSASLLLLQIIQTVLTAPEVVSSIRMARTNFLPELSWCTTQPQIRYRIRSSLNFLKQ